MSTPTLPREITPDAWSAPPTPQFADWTPPDPPAADEPAPDEPADDRPPAGRLDASDEGPDAGP